MPDAIYERHLDSSLGTGLTMPAGVASKCFAIDFFREGFLQKLVVQQTDGTPTAFTVALYNRAVNTLASSSSSANPEYDTPQALAQVTPVLAQDTGGEPLSLLADDLGYTFRNMEGTPSVRIGKIYLLLTLESYANESKWSVAIGGLASGSN